MTIEEKKELRHHIYAIYPHFDELVHIGSCDDRPCNCGIQRLYEALEHYTIRLQNASLDSANS